jgi:hypothetical protein
LELTLDAAFSVGGLVGHTSYILLVISMLMRNITWLRLFVIASAMVGIAYDGIWLANPVGVFWEGMLLLVNVVQIYLLWRRDRIAQFDDEERGFFSQRLHGMSPGQARDLLNLGRWETLPEGMVLTREGERPTHLTYIGFGHVSIMVAGRQVATCGPGHYVGEMSLIDEGPASATARVTERGRAWRIARREIDKLREDDSALAAMLDASIARDMRAKILEQNRAQSPRPSAEAETGT